MSNNNPFQYFNSSPEVIRLAVMTYVKFPLSPRNFKTIMIPDANASRSDAEHNATRSIFLQAFGGVFMTDEASALIGRKTAA